MLGNIGKAIMITFATLFLTMSMAMNNTSLADSELSDLIGPELYTLNGMELPFGLATVSEDGDIAFTFSGKDDNAEPFLEAFDSLYDTVAVLNWQRGIEVPVFTKSLSMRVNEDFEKMFTVEFKLLTET